MRRSWSTATRRPSPPTTTRPRLYFEPLTLEDVLEVVHAEQASGPLAGVIVQLGGQTPLGLARALERAGVPIVGTSPEAIHLAEDRGAFADVLAAERACRRRGTGWRPRWSRPSRWPRRSATRCWYGPPTYSAAAAWRSSTTTTPWPPTCAGRPRPSPEHPVLIDRFLDDAIEIDVDALYDGEELYLGGVMEHIEEGRHRLRRLGLRAAADHARPRRRHRGDP